MMKEYDTFVLRDGVLPEGKECRLAIRDLTPGKNKYAVSYVKALVSSSVEQLPEGETLWVRTDLGRLDKKPWKIKIIEKLGGM